MADEKTPAQELIDSFETKLRAVGDEVSWLVENRLREITYGLYDRAAVVLEYLHTGMGSWSADGYPLFVDYDNGETGERETEDVWEYVRGPRWQGYTISLTETERESLEEFADLADWWLDADFVEVRDVDFTKYMRRPGE